MSESCRVESWRPEQGPIQDPTGNIKVFIISKSAWLQPGEQGNEVG